MSSLTHLTALVSAALLGAGCLAPEPATTDTAAPLTTADVDLAPECAGIIAYANSAAQAALAAYLPTSVAAAIVARRAARPFVDIADLSSVSGIAQARLALIAGRARAAGLLDAACAGVVEELAVSVSDRDAILAFANAAPTAQLRAAARFDPDATALAIVAGRPYTALEAIAAVPGVGIETFRSLRDAAISDPFDDVVARVNATGGGSLLATGFDWYEIAVEQPGQPTSLECFGVDAALVASLGGVLRPSLATGQEVLAQVTSTVSYADRFGQVGDATSGLAHLAAQVTGRSFFGCYLSYEPDPWSGIDRAFFVNTVTGYRVLTETRWSE
jgi:DNA uptake protein ComE-like DNA-binding protein